ncbi:MAG TPA: hypothetical protein VF476_08495, partial [Chitinophagaceae bacterium]
YALMAVVSLSASPAVMANDDKNNVNTELRFIGNINEQPVFHLKLDNSAEQDFTIIIRDENSNVLYRFSSNNGSYDKKFMLNTDELGDNTVRFEITIGKNQKPVVYEVNRNSKTIDEVVVNKLK